MSIKPEHPIKRRRDVLPHEEFRYRASGGWGDGAVGVPGDNDLDDRWVEVRPKLEDFDPQRVAEFVAEDRYVIVTTSGHMRSRNDLWRWEIADATHGWRYVTASTMPSHPGFPIMVRRKK